MTNKRAARRGRLRHYIALALAGTGAGMLALLAPTAEASGTHHTPTVHVVSTPEPTKAMRAAVRRCTPVPKNVRQACHSLYLRPAIGDVPPGKAVVAECIGEARLEARTWPGKGVFERYVRNCVKGNILTP